MNSSIVSNSLTTKAANELKFGIDTTYAKGEGERRKNIGSTYHVPAVILE